MHGAHARQNDRRGIQSRHVRRRPKVAGCPQEHALSISIVTTMATDGLTVTDDVSLGAWIAPRLRGEFGAVTLAVPSGYPAYARICHPASDPLGRAASWAEVAATMGRQAHSLMQWHALVGSSDPFNFTGSLWPGGDPKRGNLAPQLVDVLAEQLQGHTNDAERCVFAVWFGWAWVYGGGTSRRMGTTPAPSSSAARLANGVQREQVAFSGAELTSPRLVLPTGNTYRCGVLFRQCRNWATRAVWKAFRGSLPTCSGLRTMRGASPARCAEARPPSPTPSGICSRLHTSCAYPTRSRSSAERCSHVSRWPSLHWYPQAPW
jgi:hypothetical protein